MTAANRAALAESFPYPKSAVIHLVPFSRDTGTTTGEGQQGSREGGGPMKGKVAGSKWRELGRKNVSARLSGEGKGEGGMQ